MYRHAVLHLLLSTFSLQRVNLKKGIENTNKIPYTPQFYVRKKKIIDDHQNNT